MKLRQLFVETLNENKLETRRIFKTGELKNFFTGIIIEIYTVDCFLSGSPLSERVFL